MSHENDCVPVLWEGRPCGADGGKRGTMEVRLEGYNGGTPLLYRDNWKFI